MKNLRHLSDNTIEKIVLYIMAPLTVAIIVYMTYAIKGIYPFGNETIDYYDMGQEVLAFYYHIYDYLHGTKSAFFDWYTALGMNMSAGTSGCSNFSIFNIFFMFVKRDCILESMSLFLVIKLMCMTCSFAFCLRTISIGTVKYMKYVLSIGYGLCGYVMMHYTIMTWLDIAAMFPIIIAFLHVLIHKGKLIPYAIALALSFTMSYYLTIMILVYIFMGYGLYIAIDKYIYIKIIIAKMY